MLCFIFSFPDLRVSLQQAIYNNCNCNELPITIQVSLDLFFNNIIVKFAVVITLLAWNVWCVWKTKQFVEKCLDMKFVIRELTKNAKKVIEDSNDKTEVYDILDYNTSAISEIGSKAAIKNDIYIAIISISNLFELASKAVYKYQKFFAKYDFHRSSDNPEIIRIVVFDIEHDITIPICQSINRIVGDIKNLNNCKHEIENVLSSYRSFIKESFAISYQIAENSTDLLFTSLILEDFGKFIRLICEYDDKDSTYTKIAASELYFVAKIDLPKAVSMTPEYFLILHELYKLNKSEKIVFVRLGAVLYETLLLIINHLEINSSPTQFNQRLILYVFSKSTKEMLVEVLAKNYKNPANLPENWSITKDHNKSCKENIKMMGAIAKESFAIMEAVDNTILHTLGVTKMIDSLIKMASDAQ